jgi:hypothetical protein
MDRPYLAEVARRRPGHRQWPVAVGLAAVVLLAACGEARQAAPRTGSPPSAVPPPGMQLPPVVPEELPPPPGGLGTGEYLTLPPVPSGMYELLDRLTARFGDSTDFGTPEISLDRTRVVVRWYGAAPSTLQELLGEYADAPWDVVLEPTEFPPGELRAEAQRLVRDHAPVVQGAGTRPSGDGVDLMLSTDAVDAAGSAEAALAAHGIVSDYPLFVEVGSIVPA